MEKQTPKKSKKKWLKIILFVLLSCGILCGYPYYIDPLVISWRNYTAPKTSFIESPAPHLLLELPGNESIYQFSAIEEKDHIEIILNNSTFKNRDIPETIMDLNIQTGEIITTEGNPHSDRFYSKPISGIPSNADSWTSCPEKNLIVAVGGLLGEEYWLNLYQDKQLIKSFTVISERWKKIKNAPFASLNFSPTCDVVTLRFSGNISMEQRAPNELWLLDIPTQTLQHILTGKTVSSPIQWEMPVQSVEPSWSPDETQFVYGSGQFGLEIFDLSSKTQYQLTAPKYNLHYPKWSPSGKWIAATQWSPDVDRMLVFSTDGTLYSYTPECDMVYDFLWLPDKDMIIYECITTNWAQKNLMIWDLEDW